MTSDVDENINNGATYNLEKVFWLDDDDGLLLWGVVHGCYGMILFTWEGDLFFYEFYY